MSEKNKAILEEANAAIAEGNNEGFLSFCADDMEWTFVGDKTLKGKEAVRQWMATTYVEPPKFMVANLIAEGDFVTALGDITMKDEGLCCKNWAGLVKIAFVSTTLSHRHPIHEPQAPVQMASLPIRHHPVMCPVVSPLPALVPQSGGDDVGEGTNGSSYDGVSLGSGLRPRT
jgi:ketosteroid isomerase-like protein